MNDISRNVFVRGGPSFLRDGGVARTALNSTHSEALDVRTLTREGAFRSNPVFRNGWFDPLPLSEIGVYDHPWRSPEPVP